MKKGKAILVTALVAGMLGLIMAGLYRLGMLRSFTALASCLGCYGYCCAAVHFCRWLTDRELPLLPARTELWRPDESFAATYEQIREEEANGQQGY